MVNLRKVLVVFIGIYIAICTFLYFTQEQFIFHPTTYPEDFTFNFDNNFEEVFLDTKDGVALNAVHFKSDKKLGAVLFLHGNAGSISGWGMTANVYVENGYDIFYLDYRGFGKSQGSIHSQSELLDDAQLAYDFLKKQFSEDQIILSGTSLGSGIAAILASKNNPKKLILNSPYSSLASLITDKVFFYPKMLIKYRLETDKHLAAVKCPIYIIHGDQDRTIPHSHSLKLKKKYDRVLLTILKGAGHVNFMNRPDYLERVKQILR